MMGNDGDTAVVNQPYTEAQVSHWSKWPNITAHYRVLAPYLKEAFQWKAKNTNDYNRFVGANLMAPAVYISKQLSKQRGGVAACYTVSEGSQHKWPLLVARH